MLPLHGLVVLDLSTTTAGRFCGRILADFGATVRRQATTPKSDAMAQADDIHFDSGKTFVELPKDGEALVEVCRSADMIIETYRPGALEQAGPRIEELTNAGKIIVSITPFGQDGPRAEWEASEITMQAYGGFLLLSGDPTREPVQAGLEQMHVTAGRVAAFAALSCLFDRGQGGPGRHIDVAVAEVAASLPPANIQNYTYTGAVAGRGPRVDRLLDGRHLPAKDGYICFATAGSTPFKMFSVLLDAPELLDDRIASLVDDLRMGRASGSEELDRIVLPHVGEHSRYEMFERALNLKIVSGVVQAPGDLLVCPHLNERGYFRVVDGPSGKVKIGGIGIKRDAFDDSPAPSTPVPSSPRPAKKAAASPRPAGPLSGVRVVSLEDVFAAPWATVQLANLGADVIRVESATRMALRQMLPFPHRKPAEDFWNDGAIFTSVQRNKRAITIDLTKEEGREACRRLIATADVVVENNRPSVLERLGLGYESLAGDNPRLVMVRATGYGQTGHYKDMGAFARSIDAMSGVTYLTGYVGGEPLRANGTYMDMLTGWNTACATMLGLLHRDRSGRGVCLDVSMYEGGVSCVGPALVAKQLGVDFERIGNGHPGMAPHGVYPCDGLDRWIAIAVRDDEDWKRLAAIIADDWAVDAGLARSSGRIEQRTRLDQRLAEWTRGQEPFTLEKRLQGARVPASVLRDARDIVMDKQLRDRGFFQWVWTASRTRPFVSPHPGSPFHLSAYTVPLEVRAPWLGEHNEEILRELGYDDESIARLMDDAVIANAPANDAVGEPRFPDPAKQIASGVLRYIDEHYREVIEGLRDEELTGKR